MAQKTFPLARFLMVLWLKKTNDYPGYKNVKNDGQIVAKRTDY